MDGEMQNPFCTAQVSRTAELKEVNTRYAGQKTRSLPLSDCLIAEIKHNRGVYLTIMLVTEASLPFRAVEYTSWKLLSNAMPGFSLIRSRNTIPEKLKQYPGYFRKALIQLLKNSTFLDIQLGVWRAADHMCKSRVEHAVPPHRGFHGQCHL